MNLVNRIENYRIVEPSPYMIIRINDVIDEEYYAYPYRSKVVVAKFYSIDHYRIVGNPIAYNFVSIEDFIFIGKVSNTKPYNWEHYLKIIGD